MPSHLCHLTIVVFKTLPPLSLSLVSHIYFGLKSVSFFQTTRKRDGIKKPLRDAMERKENQSVDRRTLARSPHNRAPRLPDWN